MARYGLFVLKVPLNPNQPTNHLFSFEWMLRVFNLYNYRRSWRKRVKVQRLMLLVHHHQQQQQLLVSRHQHAKNQMSIRITWPRLVPVTSHVYHRIQFASSCSVVIIIFTLLTRSSFPTLNTHILFTGHFLGEPGLASSFHLNFPSPVIPVLFILLNTVTTKCYSADQCVLFHELTSSYSIWPNQHHPYIQQVQIFSICLFW